MKVQFKRIEDDMMQYECIDNNNKKYGVADTIVDGNITDTMVIDMETLDEVEDSELFKNIVIAKTLFICENQKIQKKLKAIY